MKNKFWKRLATSVCVCCLTIGMVPSILATAAEDEQNTEYSTEPGSGTTDGTDISAYDNEEYDPGALGEDGGYVEQQSSAGIAVVEQDDTFVREEELIKGAVLNLDAFLYSVVSDDGLNDFYPEIHDVTVKNPEVLKSEKDEAEGTWYISVIGNFGESSDVSISYIDENGTQKEYTFTITVAQDAYWTELLYDYSYEYNMVLVPGVREDVTLQAVHSYWDADAGEIKNEILDNSAIKVVWGAYYGSEKPSFTYEADEKNPTVCHVTASDLDRNWNYLYADVQVKIGDEWQTVDGAGVALQIWPFYMSEPDVIVEDVDGDSVTVKIGMIKYTADDLNNGTGGSPYESPVVYGFNLMGQNIRVTYNGEQIGDYCSLDGDPFEDNIYVDGYNIQAKDGNYITVTFTNLEESDAELWVDVFRWENDEEGNAYLAYFEDTWVTLHMYDEGQTVKAPTCTEDGVLRYICEECGETFDKAIPAAGHNWDKGVVTAPTATEKGYTTYTCTVCGKTRVDNYTPAAGTSDKKDTKTDKPAKTTKTNTTVKTGDSVTFGIPVIMLVLALGGILGVVVYRKRIR